MTFILSFYLRGMGESSILFRLNDSLRETTLELFLLHETFYDGIMPFFLFHLYALVRFSAMENTVGRHNPNDILLLQASQIVYILSFTGASEPVFG